jgi:hypothetical protein
MTARSAASFLLLLLSSQAWATADSQKCFVAVPQDNVVSDSAAFNEVCVDQDAILFKLDGAEVFTATAALVSCTACRKRCEETSIRGPNDPVVVRCKANCRPRVTCSGS